VEAVVEVAGKQAQFTVLHKANLSRRCVIFKTADETYMAAKQN